MRRVPKNVIRTGAWLLPLAIGLALRLWQNDLTPFLDDEAVLLTAAARLLDTGQLPLEAGLALSIHLNEPPLVVYLDAIPMLVSRNPVWVSTCLTAVDALACVLLYQAAKRLAGNFAGFVAATLYAVAPAAIYFSRRLYYSELVPFCCAVTLLALTDVWQRRNARSLAIALVAAACATELHASAAILLLVWLAVAAATWRSMKAGRAVSGAVVIVLATLAPYLYLQTRNGWADVMGVVRFTREPKLLDGSALDQAVAVIGGGISRQLLLPFPQTAPPFWLDPIGWLLVATVAAGCVIALTKRSATHLTVLAVLILPVLASLRHAYGVLPYYLLPSLPAAVILAGVAFGAVSWRIVGAGVLAVIAGWQAAGFVNVERLAASDGMDRNYGMPVRYELAAASIARASVADGERLSVSQVGNQAKTFPYLTAGRYRIVESDSRYGVSLPGQPVPSSYLVQGGGHVYSFLEQRFGPPPRVVTSTSGRPAFGFYQLPPSALTDVHGAMTPIEADVAHAVQLRGYFAPDLAAGRPSTLLLEWQVTDPAAALPSEVQQFAHLVDQSGVTWSTNSDERAYPRTHWSAGDVVLTWFDLAPKPITPTGGYWIETGFYGYITNQALPVYVTTSSQPGAALRIGPLRVAGGQVARPIGEPLAVFGEDELALLAATREGGDVALTWEARRQPSSGYTVFVHLLAADGRLVAQHDGPPQNGAFPTTLWRAGDVATDVHRLQASATGTTLEIGLYTTPDLRRLPVSTGGDFLKLPG